MNIASLLKRLLHFLSSGWKKSEEPPLTQVQINQVTKCTCTVISCAPCGKCSGDSSDDEPLSTCETVPLIKAAPIGA